MRSPSSFWKLPGNHDIGYPDAARADIPSLIAAGKANGEIAEALIRETARRDGPLGSAKRDFETIHIGKKYDIELQSEAGAEANVETLLRAWKGGETQVFAVA